MTNNDYDYVDYENCQKKYNNLTSIFSHPNITTFKKVENIKKKKIYFEKNKMYPIELLHLMKPKIKIEKKNKYYIDMIKKLYNIDEIESINKIKKFNGDIYYTIVFG